MVLELEISCISFKKDYLLREVVVDYYERIGTNKLAFWHLFDAIYTLFKAKIRKF